MSGGYVAKELSYSEAMARIVKQFKCSRKEAYDLMKLFIERDHFKLKKEDN